MRSIWRVRRLMASSSPIVRVKAKTLSLLTSLLPPMLVKSRPAQCHEPIAWPSTTSFSELTKNSVIRLSTWAATCSTGPDTRESLSKVQGEYIQEPSVNNTRDTGVELRRLQTLLDAARLLNSTLELKELTQIILDVVRTEVPVDRVSVFVVDRARNGLYSLVAQELEGFEITFPLGTGIAGTVAATGEVLDISDAYADPRF